MLEGCGAESCSHLAAVLAHAGLVLQGPGQDDASAAHPPVSPAQVPSLLLAAEHSAEMGGDLHLVCQAVL